MLATLLGLTLLWLPANASEAPPVPQPTRQPASDQASFELLRPLRAAHRQPAEPRPVHRPMRNRRAWFEDDVEELSRDHKPLQAWEITRGLELLKLDPCALMGSADLNCAPHVPLIYAICTLLI